MGQDVAVGVAVPQDSRRILNRGIVDQRKAILAGTPSQANPTFLFFYFGYAGHFAVLKLTIACLADLTGGIEKVYNKGTKGRLCCGKSVC